MAHFCALLSFDFEVCRLVTGTVSDHIRKTVTNRLFSEPQRQEPGSIVTAGTSSTFSTHFIKALQLIY